MYFIYESTTSFNFYYRTKRQPQIKFGYFVTPSPEMKGLTTDDWKGQFLWEDTVAFKCFQV